MKRCAIALLALASCRRPHVAADASPHRPDVTRAVRDVSAPPPDVIARPDVSPATQNGTPTRAVRAVSEGDAPGELVSVPGGAVRVWAVNHDDRRQSEIVAQRHDPDGRPIGAVRLLRRTTGPVAQLSADARAEALWVAWATVRETTGRMPFEEINAAMRVSVDLARVERPVTLADFGRRDEGTDGNPSSPDLNIEVVALDDGGAAVLANGPPAMCLHNDSDDVNNNERVECGSVNLTWLSAAGVARTTNESHLAMGAPAQSLVRVAAGVMYSVQIDHIMTNTELVYAQPPGTAAVALSPQDGLPNHGVGTLAFTGDAVVAVSNNVEMESRGVEAHVRRVDGTYVTTETQESNGLFKYPLFRGARLRCVQGMASIAVSWAGGSIELTPDARSSFRMGDWINPEGLRLPRSDAGGARVFSSAAWAGRALLAVVDGAVLRWTCSPAGRLVLAP